MFWFTLLITACQLGYASRQMWYAFSSAAGGYVHRLAQYSMYTCMYKIMIMVLPSNTMLYKYHNCKICHNNPDRWLMFSYAVINSMVLIDAAKLQHGKKPPFIQRLHCLGSCLYHGSFPGKRKIVWQRWDSNPRLRRDRCLKPRYQLINGPPTVQMIQL